MSKQIEALLTEREGYLKRGLVERVKSVDEALRELGFDHKYLSEPDIETASFEVESEKARRKKSKKRAK